MGASGKFAIAWLILAAIFAAILGPINVPTYLKLLKHGERTSAEILRLDCDNHNQAEYVFNVGAIGVLSSDVMISDCRLLRPGDAIPIYYDVTDPTVNRAEEPMGGLVNELIAITLVCLTFPSLIIVGVSRWPRRNKARPSN
jgi:hypothetical protein